ncbi:MAG TPA: hypothetical protein VFA74_03390 [Terriglobales bacterium]|nr:hypothetical protein [Terriglobales bacterium]
MKIVSYIELAGCILIGMLVPIAGAQSQPASSPAAQGQSLGDYARAVRKDKKPSSPKKYDNDNLPVSDKLSVVGNAGASDSKSADAAASKDDPAANASGEKKAKSPADETAEEKQARYNEWKDKLSNEKGEVDAAAKELDLLQREYRLRAAAFYGDAGDRLRNSAEWDKENTQYQEQIADKQKLVDEAKQKLDQMQEEARKAGVPSSVRE